MWLFRFGLSAGRRTREFCLSDVRNNEVGVVNKEIHERRGYVNAAETANGKHADKRQCETHGRLESQRATPDRSQPIKSCDRRRNRDHHRRERGGRLSPNYVCQKQSVEECHPVCQNIPAGVVDDAFSVPRKRFGVRSEGGKGAHGMVTPMHAQPCDWATLSKALHPARRVRQALSPALKR
jgi:hypothetical protein